MKIKEFKKLDVDSKLDVIFKELIMLRKINTIQEEEINVSKRYIIEVIHPAIEELFDEPEMLKELKLTNNEREALTNAWEQYLKDSNVGELVEFLKSNGYYAS